MSGNGEVAGGGMAHGDGGALSGTDVRDMDVGDAVDFHGDNLEGVHYGASAGGRGGDEVDAGRGDGNRL